MRRIPLPTLLFLALPAVVAAQDSNGGEALQALVGEWSYDQIEGGASCHMLGANHVACEASYRNDTGTLIHALFVTGYNPATEQYTSTRFYGGGYADAGRTWIDGDTWTTLYVNDNGVVWKFEATLEGDSWNYHWEGFNSDGDLEETSRGSMTRR